MQKKFLLYTLGLLFSFSQAFSAPRQIVIVPSAEQNGIDLTLKGKERSQALSPYLINNSNYNAAGNYYALFAAKPSYACKSFASQKTFLPLGWSLSLPVHSPYGVGQESLLVDLIMSSDVYEGKNIAIVWDSSAILNLIGSFHFTISFSYTGQSDVVFVLIDPSSPGIALAYPQQLLYGDSSSL